MRHERGASEPCTAKSISIKNGKCRSGDCAWKAAGITPGGLFLRRGSATEGVERRPDRRAEVSRGLTRSEEKSRPYPRIRPAMRLRPWSVVPATGRRPEPLEWSIGLESHE